MIGKRIHVTFRLIAFLASATLLTSGQIALAETNDTPSTPIVLDGTSASAGSGGAQISTAANEFESEKVITSGSGYTVTSGKISPEEMQLIINIETQDSPTVFNFPIKGATGIEPLNINGKPLYRVYNAQNSSIGWISEPWAKSATGVDVPTHFEINGNLLTQIVETAGLTASDFPVVADPYLGLDLISKVSYSVDSKRSSTNLKIAVTPWLGIQYAVYLPWTLLGGSAIAVTYGWPEVLSKYTSNYGIWMTNFIKSKQTYNDQYRCHALGAPVIFATQLTDPSSTWDLEGHRAPNNSLSTWITTFCNW
jgi:hypothetical protein